jgi:hypothetical protein
MYDDNHLDMDHEDNWDYSPWELVKQRLVPFAYMTVASVTFVAIFYFNH